MSARRKIEAELTKPRYHRPISSKHEGRRRGRQAAFTRKQSRATVPPDRNSKGARQWVMLLVCTDKPCCPNFERLQEGRPPRVEQPRKRPPTAATVLDILIRKWPCQFTANAVAEAINLNPTWDDRILREFLLPEEQPNHALSAVSVGKLVQKHVGEPVRHDGRTLVLRAWQDGHAKRRNYRVDTSART